MILERLRRASPTARLDDVADVGGESELYRAGDDIADSDAFDVAAHMLTDAWPQVDQAPAAGLLLAGLGRTPDPLAFRHALDHVLEHPDVVVALGGRLNDVLLQRAAQRSDARQAHIAVDALDGAIRLTLAGSTRPFRLLDLMSSVTVEEIDTFAEAAARRLGVIYLHVPEPSARDAARDTLQRLADHPAARGDAHHELGATWLVDALEADTPDAVESGLRQARREFSAAINADAERVDAQLYASAIDGVLALVEQRPAAEVQQAAADVEALALTRIAWRASSRLNRWLGDTTAAEQEWWMVTAAFAAAADELTDDVWMTAATSLEAIARAHRATRIARVLPGDAPGLSAVIEPRISVAFIRHSYRMQQLQRWADEIRDQTDLAAAAAELQEVVDDPKGDTATRIAELRAAATEPDQVDRILAGLQADEQAALERRLHTLDGEDSVLSNPAAARVRSDIRAALAGAADYGGTTRLLLDRIVDTTIAYIDSRQNVQPSGAFAYLAAPNALEESVHLDYYHYLSATPLGDIVQIESAHIGGGRADVLFTYGGTRIVAEIKRDANPTAVGRLDPYLNQAGLYQTSNVALGLLIVLDLSAKPQGQLRSLGHSIWVAQKPALTPGDTPRTIVTALVPGNRPTPSQVK
jgi:hypothetical protein